MLTIKAQSIARRWLAIRRVKGVKSFQMKQLFSADRKNHKDPNTLMLTQRVGALKLDDLKKDDGVERIFIATKTTDEDGNEYVGEWLKNQPKVKDGVGRLFFANGAKYEGQFTNGQIEGFGRKIYPNGEYYIGEFK